MARSVDFKELQAGFDSLNQAGVIVYGVKVRTTMGELDELEEKLQFEPDEGMYQYVANNNDRTISEAPVNYILVYWSVQGGKVTVK